MADHPGIMSRSRYGDGRADNPTLWEHRLDGAMCEAPMPVMTDGFGSALGKKIEKVLINLLGHLVDFIHCGLPQF
jgi:hypothetical protein